MASSRQSLTKGLERKVLAIVRRYIDELPVVEKNDGPLCLSVSKVYQYVIADGSVPRQKKQNLEKMIEKAMDTIRDEEAEADGLDSGLSEFEGLVEEGSMEPKVPQSYNNVYSIWNSNILTLKPPPGIKRNEQAGSRYVVNKHFRHNNSQISSANFGTPPPHIQQHRTSIASTPKAKGTPVHQGWWIYEASETKRLL